MNFLTGLVQRTLNATPSVSPVIPSLYELAAADAANDAAPDLAEGADMRAGRAGHGDPGMEDVRVRPVRLAGADEGDRKVGDRRSPLLDESPDPVGLERALASPPGRAAHAAGEVEGSILQRAGLTPAVQRGVLLEARPTMGSAGDARPQVAPPAPPPPMVAPDRTANRPLPAPQTRSQDRRDNAAERAVRRTPARAETEPVIHVHIGRIDLRATSSSTELRAVQDRKARTAQSATSLEDYLRGGNGGKR